MRRRRAEPSEPSEPFTPRIEEMKGTIHVHTYGERQKGSIGSIGSESIIPINDGDTAPTDGDSAPDPITAAELGEFLAHQITGSHESTTAIARRALVHPNTILGWCDGKHLSTVVAFLRTLDTLGVEVSFRRRNEPTEP